MLCKEQRDGIGMCRRGWQDVSINCLYQDVERLQWSIEQAGYGSVRVACHEVFAYQSEGFADEDYAKLFSIGVSPTTQSKGVGEMLLVDNECVM